MGNWLVQVVKLMGCLADFKYSAVGSSFSHHINKMCKIANTVFHVAMHVRVKCLRLVGYHLILKIEIAAEMITCF